MSHPRHPKQSSHRYGGLGLGTTGTSYIFLACILVLVGVRGEPAAQEEG